MSVHALRPGGSAASFIELTTLIVSAMGSCIGFRVAPQMFQSNTSSGQFLVT